MRRRVIAATLCAAGCASLIAPWMLRNAHVFGKHIYGATNGGAAFFGGNNDLVAAGSAHPGGWVSSRLITPEDGALPEIEREQMQWRRGIDWLTSHADEIAPLIAWKMIRFSLPDWDSANKKYVWLGWITTLPLLVLAAIGMIIAHRLTREWLAIDLVMAATIATAVIFWGSPRFRDASLCVLLVYAGAAADVVTKKFRSHINEMQQSGKHSRAT
jgi:hypothetical protein